MTRRGVAVLFIAVTQLIGCAVGPDYHRPSIATTATYAPEPIPHQTESVAGAAQDFDPARDIAGDWWTLFQSPELTQLIEDAFRANPSIDSAVAALREAQENVYAQRGLFFPTLQTSSTSQRSKLSGNTAGGSAPGAQGNGENIVPLGPAQPVTYNFHTAELTVGFVPDVFGANRRQVESLQAQADAARYQLEATYVTLASNVVAATVQEAAVRAQIRAIGAIIESDTRSLSILREQSRLGYATAIDVAAQESALAQARQQLSPLKQQLEQTRDLLRLLVGNAPDHDVPETFELDTLHLPENLPLSLPSRLIEQRPDVRAAEAQVHAASAQIGVAVANRLPQFSIAADLGGNATQLGQMFQGAGTFWDVIGSASQTLFDGGTLRHRQHAAEQAFSQAAAQYRLTVLIAFQNVADTLHALLSDAEALQAALDARQAAKTTLDLTQKQLDAGYVDYPALQSAQWAFEQADLSLIQARAQRFGDTAALFQALGGGWWNRIRN